METMKPTFRYILALVVLIGLVSLVVGIDALQRRASGRASLAGATLPPGSIPIFLDGVLRGAFTPNSVLGLPTASFTDSEESKTQAGYLLRDVVLQAVGAEMLSPDTLVVVSSSSRSKSARLYWSQVNTPANQILLALGGRGTFKLVSILPELDTRDEWIQDVDRIEVTAP
jgi:hypothetical protein